MHSICVGDNHACTANWLRGRMQRRMGRARGLPSVPWFCRGPVSPARSRSWRWTCPRPITRPECRAGPPPPGREATALCVVGSGRSAQRLPEERPETSPPQAGAQAGPWPCAVPVGVCPWLVYERAHHVTLLCHHLFFLICPQFLFCSLSSSSSYRVTY